MAERGVEVKVGLFLLLALGLLVAFLLILGNFRFSPGPKLFIDYTNSGGLRNGAKVKVAGVSAGSVTDIRFTGGQSVNDAGQQVFVQVTIELTDEMAPTVTKGSQFYISTDGLLGEKYIEVTPGPPGAVPIEPGTTVSGEPPIELQVLSARAASAVDKLQKLVDGQNADLSEAATSLRELLERSNRVARTLDEELPGVIERMNATMDRVRNSLEGLDRLAADGSELLNSPDGVKETVASLAGAAATLDMRLPELIDQGEILLVDAQALAAASQSTLDEVEKEFTAAARDARGLVRSADGLVQRTDPRALITKLEGAVGQLTADFGETGRTLQAVAGQLEKLVSDLTQMAADVRRGKGTLGALLTDREVYDDIRELLLDLKRNPWKVLWKE